MQLKADSVSAAVQSEPEQHIEPVTTEFKAKTFSQAGKLNPPYRIIRYKPRHEVDDQRAFDEAQPQNYTVGLDLEDSE